MMKKVLLSLFGATLLFGGAQAQQLPVIDLFYGAECPHCHEEIEWLERVVQFHSELKVNKYEVWHDKGNHLLMENRLRELDASSPGVPVSIIDGQVIVGFKREAILEQLKISYGLDCDRSCDAENPNLLEGTPKWESYLKFSWPLMAVALGLADGFNPCAMWSLFVLIGFLLGIENKNRRWLIGAIFIASSGIIYFSALLAYLFGFAEISAMVATETMGWVFRGVGVLAVTTGARVLWIARRAQIECSVRDASSRQKFSQKMVEILERKSLLLVILGVIGLAFSVNSVELLCSFAIPTTFTAALVSLDLPTWKDLTALFIYDLAYMLDDLIVFLIAMWTLSLKVFSPKIVQWSHFAGGLMLLAIGAALLLNPELLTQIMS